MSYLSTATRALLNAFSKSQPALNFPGVSEPEAQIQLGDLIEGAALDSSASAAAAAASAAAALVSKNAAAADVILTDADVVLTHADVVAAAASAASLHRGQGTSDAITGDITVAGMTATGAALAFDVTTAAPYVVTCGAGVITITPASTVNWLVIKLS